MDSSNKQRLQKVIAQGGLASRRGAEQLILEGKVKVNNKVVDSLGYKVEASDEITVEGKLLKKETYYYYLLNKPKGYLSSVRDPHHEKTVLDLIKDAPVHLYPVGRLDHQTTGALILTNDGEFTQLMTHPRHHVGKKYRVTVRGILSPKDIQTIANGMVLNREKLQPVKLSDLEIDEEKKTTRFTLVLYEGKNRQIRLMMEALYHDVLKLHRIGISFINVDDLRIGEYRQLTKNEVRALINEVKGID